MSSLQCRTQLLPFCSSSISDGRSLRRGRKIGLGPLLPRDEFATFVDFLSFSYFPLAFSSRIFRRGPSLKTCEGRRVPRSPLKRRLYCVGAIRIPVYIYMQMSMTFTISMDKSVCYDLRFPRPDGAFSSILHLVLHCMHQTENFVPDFVPKNFHYDVFVIVYHYSKCSCSCSHPWP